MDHRSGWLFGATGTGLPMTAWIESSNPDDLECRISGYCKLIWLGKKAMHVLCCNAMTEAKEEMALQHSWSSPAGVWRGGGSNSRERVAWVPETIVPLISIHPSRPIPPLRLYPFSSFPSLLVPAKLNLLRFWHEALLCSSPLETK